MSLGSIMNAALSGLTAAQTSLSTTSNNITNVNTPGYARKVVQQEQLVAGGQGVGVKISDIQRITDQFLAVELRSATGDASRYTALNQMHGELQSLLGNPADQTSVSGGLNTMFTSLATLAGDPSQQISRSAALNAIQDFGDQVGRLAGQLQSLRGTADGRVVQDVATVNDAITRIDSLNQKISHEQLTGRSTAALEDQRDQALTDLSKVIDIRTFTLRNGTIGVATGSGITLLDETKRQLVYNSPGVVTSATQFNQITVNRVSPTTGTLETTGTPLDPAVQSGSLRGWLDMRDHELPALAGELGEFARATADQLNAVHNANVAVPPPASLTGRNTGLTASDLPGFTGQATFYTLDSSNQVVQSVRVDFDSGQVFNPPTAGAATGTFTTLGDLTSAVTTALGTSGTLSLANGVMSMTAAGGASGVAIQQGSVAAGAQDSSRGGRGFSQFFGMNDLVQTAVPLIRDTGFSATSPLSMTGQTTLQFRGPNNEVAATVTVDFGQPPLSNPGANFTDLLGVLNSTSGLGRYASFGLDAKGALTVTPASGYGDYRLQSVEDTTNRGGTTARLRDLFCIGSANQADPAKNFNVRADIKATPSMLALARVDTTTGLPAGTPVLTLGDATGAMALQNVAQQVVQMPGAGKLGSASVTLSDYAGQILSGAARDAATADSALKDRTTLQSELQKRSDSVSGVNLDEELAKMIVLQNAYNASGRLLTTAKEMFDALLRF